MPDETVIVERIPTEEITRERAWERPHESNAFGGRLCLIRCTPHHPTPAAWFLGPNRGTTHDRNAAHVYTVADALYHTVGHSGDVFELLLEGPVLMYAKIPPAPAPAEKEKYPIEQILTPAILELLKAAPLNEVVRTQIHAAILVPLPAEAKTFEEIKAWIEEHAIPAGRRPTRPSTPETTFHSGINATVNFRGRETGTCRYQVATSGEGDYNITHEELDRALNTSIEDGGNWDDFYARVSNLLEDIASEDPPDIGPEDTEYEHVNYERSDDEILSRDVLDFQVTLRNWVIAHHPLEMEDLAEPGAAPPPKQTTNQKDKHEVSKVKMRLAHAEQGLSGPVEGLIPLPGVIH